MREREIVCVLGWHGGEPNDCIGLIWNGTIVPEKAGKRKRLSVCLQV